MLIVVDGGRTGQAARCCVCPGPSGGARDLDVRDPFPPVRTWPTSGLIGRSAYVAQKEQLGKRCTLLFGLLQDFVLPRLTIRDQMKSQLTCNCSIELSPTSQSCYWVLPLQLRHVRWQCMYGKEHCTFKVTVTCRKQAVDEDVLVTVTMRLTLLCLRLSLGTMTATYYNLASSISPIFDGLPSAFESWQLDLTLRVQNVIMTSVNFLVQTFMVSHRNVPCNQRKSLLLTLCQHSNTVVQSFSIFERLRSRSFKKLAIDLSLFGSPLQTNLRLLHNSTKSTRG